MQAIVQLVAFYDIDSGTKPGLWRAREALCTD